ncbi:acyl-CoA thioesterase [Streptomyces sp. DASNCL29]|uniref:acyl-CoA thioesterase n=1 Tax=Streptomyces sp. DASNCL29 TaxID=2583819 RepID=UPI00110FAE6E|nr:acyl-CoA thioesterase [Streptomyces sp. DASNCL29]TMU98478.1 acyl-CoA thioesterase [Streptomyces sp. DASNCL29]
MPRYSYECPLRWFDMDVYGHVNNVTILRYLEEARVALLFRAAAEAGEDGLASGLVVARHEVDYLKPLEYRAEPVTVETWISTIRKASFTISHEVKDTRDDGTQTVYARASTLLAPYDFRTARPRRITSGEAIFLTKHMPEPSTPIATTSPVQASAQL